MKYIQHFQYREDQVDEYRDLKKDLEQTAKNCRILQFKLRKADRRIEQLEADKHELEVLTSGGNSSSSGKPVGSGPSSSAGKDQHRITQLEQELSQIKEQLLQSQREVQKLQTQISRNSTASGPVLSKSRSLEVGLLHIKKKLNWNELFNFK